MECYIKWLCSANGNVDLFEKVFDEMLERNVFS